MANMSQIVSQLKVLTGQNRVPWKTTSDRSAFVAVYGDLSVRIASRGDEPQNTVVLGVYDKLGNLLDSASHDASIPPAAPRPPAAQLNISMQNDYSDLKPLYQSARRIALGADQSLANLLERMNASPPVSTD